MQTQCVSGFAHRFSSYFRHPQSSFLHKCKEQCISKHDFSLTLGFALGFRHGCRRLLARRNCAIWGHLMSASIFCIDPKDICSDFSAMAAEVCDKLLGNMSEMHWIRGFMSCFPCFCPFFALILCRFCHCSRKPAGPLSLQRQCTSRAATTHRMALSLHEWTALCCADSKKARL